MDFVNIRIILGKEIREGFRNRWFVLTSAIFAALTLALSALGLSGLGNLGVSGFGRTAASLLNLVILIVPMMALLLGAMSVAAEREQGTLRALMAQPVTAAEILLGKFLGSAVVLTAAILIGFGLNGVVIGFHAGAEHFGSFLSLVGFTVVLGAAYLGIGFLVSVSVQRSSSAAGTALFLWFLFLFLSDLGLIGTSIALKLSPRELLWLTILNPSQAFKIGVIGSLHGDLEVFGAAGRYALDAFGNGFYGLIAAVFLGWILAPLAVALAWFRARSGQ